MCVAFSSSALKAWQDKRDQGHWFDFDEQTFFHRIGGTAQGAHVRAAMRELKQTGYPTKQGRAERHRIDAYYRVPPTAQDIKRVIRRLGPVILSVEWARSWFTPRAGGMLPPWDHFAGGHAIMAIGWNAKGIRVRNSWGSGWGRNGNATMPYADLGHVKEVWKTYDRVTK